MRPAPQRRRIKPRTQGRLNHRRWRTLRDQVVREEPVCRLRLRGICTLKSTTGDHIIPVSLRPDKRFDRSNVRGSCAPCNQYRSNRPLSVVRAELERAHPTAKALEFFR